MNGACVRIQKTCLLTFVVLPWLSGISPAAEGTYELPRITVSVCEKAPVIDGILSPKEWEDAACIGGFMSAATGEMAGRQTQVYITYDSDRIYLAFLSPVAAGETLQANAQSRDEAVWNDDAIEIFLPGRKNDFYYHFIGNSKGIFYDSQGDQKEWNGAWQYQCGIRDNEWVAEVSMGFSDLGTRCPADGDTWRVNLCRDWQSPQEFTAWPKIKSFNDSKLYGYLKFKKESPVARINSFDFVDQTIDIKAKIFSKDIKRLHSFKGRLSLSVGDKKILEEEIEPLFDAAANVSKTAVFDIKKEIADKKADKVTLSLADNQGEMFFFSEIPFRWASAVGLKMVHRPTEGQSDLFIDLGNMDIKSPAAAVEVVAVEGGVAYQKIEVKDFIVGGGRAKIDTRSLKSGEYKVVTRILDGDKVVFEKALTFVKPSAEWRNSHVGVTDKVLSPWTPIKVKKESGGQKVGLLCWGREYGFDKTLFPSRIITQGEAILSSPIELAADLGGKKVEWENVELKITEGKDAKVSFTTTAKHETLKAQVKGYLEFDGMMYFELELDPASPVSLDRLVLNIPFKQKHAQYWMRPFQVPPNSGRAIGSEADWKWEDKFECFTWVGNYDGGLTWFAESVSGWKLKDSSKAVGLYRAKETVVYRLNLIDAPVVLDKPVKIAFGIQATPVKALPGRWREWGVNSKQQNIRLQTEGATTYSGYPESSDLAHMRQYVADSRSRDLQAVPYGNLIIIPDDTPEWLWYGNQWEMPSVASGDPTPSGGRYRGICPAVKDVRNFMTYKYEKMAKEVGYRGLYFDWCWGAPCYSRNHGHEPGDFPILALREFMKRMYAMMKAIDPENTIIVHTSGGACTPFASFADITLQGEELGGIGKGVWQTSLVDVISPNYFRANNLARPLGLVPWYLPSANSEYESLVTFLLLHDVHFLYDRWEEKATSFYKAFAAFGIGSADVAFFPYWLNDQYVKASFQPKEGAKGSVKYPEPMVSIYHRPGKVSLLLVSNFTDEDRKVDLRISFQALGCRKDNAALADAFSMYPWYPAQDVMTVDVPRKNGRIIWLEPRGDKKLISGVNGIPFIEKTMLAGTGDIKDAEIGVPTVGDIVKDYWPDNPDLPKDPQLSKVAQKFTLGKSAVISHFWLKFREDVATTGNGKYPRNSLSLDIVKASPEGLPSDVPVDKDLVVYQTSWPPRGNHGYSLFCSNKALGLKAGSYYLVLSKRPELLEKQSHYKIPLFPSKHLPDSGIAVWENQRPGEAKAVWNKAEGVMAFGLQGYWQE